MTREEELFEKLKRIAAEGKAANAYLLTGGTEESRRNTANRFAKLLVTSEADIIRTEHEKPHLIGVDDVRAGINENVFIRPYGTGKKVYIVDEAEKMNVQAQNALLKTLEEPPTYVVILLLAPTKETFLQTVLSRAVKISLQEAENGGTGDADIHALLALGRRMTPTEVNEFIRNRAKEKDTQLGFLEFIRSWFLDVLIYKTERSTRALHFPADAEVIKEYADYCSFSGINGILNRVTETAERISLSVNFELAATVLFDDIRKELEERDV